MGSAGTPHPRAVTPLAYQDKPQAARVVPLRRDKPPDDSASMPAVPPWSAPQRRRLSVLCSVNTYNRYLKHETLPLETVLAKR